MWIFRSVINKMIIIVIVCKETKQNDDMNFIVLMVAYFLWDLILPACFYLANSYN